MHNKKGQAVAILSAVVILVTLVIGVSIIDVITNTNINGDRVPATGNETVGTANASGYLSTTLNNPPVVADTEQVFCGLATTSNYTLTDSSGLIVVNGADCINDTVLASYYNSDARFSFGIARTIVTYIAPIALLGALAFAAFMFGG